MPLSNTTRIHETDFCAQIASYSNAIFSAHPEYPFGSARIEGFGTGTQKSKRKDLRIYDRSNRLILCGEVKLPGTPEGRSPYADDLVRDAHQKADDAGVQYFFTWNVDLFVLWDRKKWDVPLIERRVCEWPLGQQVTSPDQAGRPDILALIERRFLPNLFLDLTEICTGRKTDWSMPPDDIFIRSMESHLEWPITLTRTWMLQQAEKSKAFDSKLQEWMAGQDWTFVRKDAEEWYAAIHRAASSLGYLLMNRIIFYKALFDKFEDLPRLDFKPRVKTAADAYANLQELFEKAVKRSGDYEPLFYPHERDWAGTLLFEAPSAIDAWKGVLRAVGGVDFRRVSSDVLGRIFQRLIGPEERHRYGQHFTGDDVVDVINAFCIRTADAAVLDPACGSGSFLVRAYYRKKTLRPRKAHQELLAELFGSDISLYPAHLATLNLAAREINEEANYPRIARRNFLHFHKGQEFCRLPDRDRKEISIKLPPLDAVVANPPYVRQEKIEKKEKGAVQRLLESMWDGLRLSGRSDYHCYFWPASAALLKEGAYFGFLTSSSWLDVEYGFRLQRWALSNFQLLAVMESNAEPWFPDARVKTCVTIMRRCSDEEQRMATAVRFVQFKRPLAEIIDVPVAQEEVRQEAAQRLREEIESVAADTADDRMRIIVKRQRDLWEAGVRAGRILGDAPILTVALGTETDSDEDAESEESETPPITPGDYVAGKWGRYLRAPDFYFEIMREFGSKFVPLGELVGIRFGVKSGCDAFFMPHDITQEALERHKGDREFRRDYVVERREVSGGRVKIIKAGDGSVHPIESKFLAPEVHSLMKVDRPAVHSSELDRLVLLVGEPVSELQHTFVLKYIKYGQTHTFASKKSKAVPVPERSSCQGRDPWYDLTGLVKPGFVLWPMAQQYRHIIAENADGLICNHNLFDLINRDLSPEEAGALVAVLNSTLVGLFKTFYGRFAGTEGNLKTEVVDVNLIEVPDTRGISRDLHARLVGALGSMQRRPVGRLVEEQLMDCHDPERAKRIAATPLALSQELCQADRRSLDDAVFELLGVPDPARRAELVNELHRETALHFRSIRIVEIQKMEQRRKSSQRKFSTEELAADLWDAADIADLTPLAEWLRREPGLEAAVIIPDGGAYLSDHAEMFDAATIYFGKNRKEHVVCNSREEAELVKLIADLGVRGTVNLPPAPEECVKLKKKIQARFESARLRFDELAQTRTSLDEKQDEVVELLLRWFALGRTPNANAAPQE